LLLGNLVEFLVVGRTVGFCFHVCARIKNLELVAHIISQECVNVKWRDRFRRIAGLTCLDTQNNLS